MNNTPLHPDAPRTALKQLVRKSPMKQKAIAEAVGQREDTFSKILKGAESYDLKSPLVINVLNVIDVPFSVFAELVEKESKRLYATDGN